MIAVKYCFLWGALSVIIFNLLDQILTQQFNFIQRSAGQPYLVVHLSRTELEFLVSVEEKLI